MRPMRHVDLVRYCAAETGKKTAGISDENEHALQRWQAAGGLAGIATSRSAGYIQKYQFANLGGSRRLERSGDRARRPPLAASAAKPERKAIVENFRR